MFKHVHVNDTLSFKVMVTLEVGGRGKGSGGA